MRHDFNPIGKFRPFSGKLRLGEGRSLFILLGILALGAAIFAGSYFVSQRACLTTRISGRFELAAR